MIIDTDNLAASATSDLQEAIGFIEAEVTLRVRAESLDDRMFNLVREVQELSGIHVTPGEPWVQPTGYQDAYPIDFEVTHGGKRWISQRNGASGEPGLEPGDWVEVVEEGQVLDWVQPMAGGEYIVGAIVRHNGHLWENIHVGPNGWEPGTTGAQWKDLGPA